MSNFAESTSAYVFFVCCFCAFNLQGCMHVSGIQCWNPAFDVTPAELITGGIITEYGVFPPGKLRKGLAQYLWLP